MTATRALIEAGTERLRAAGSDTPRLDAELLLAYAIGVDRTAVIAHGEAPVGPDAAAMYDALIARRASGEPVAYLRGLKEFHGIALSVDARALIPRPDTEVLVDTAIAIVMRALTSGVERATPLRVADVGTGSGAIAVALAVALRGRRVPPDELEIVALDVSEDALQLARENAVGHGVGDRIRFLASDLLPPDARSAPFDIVLANLPYVRTAELDANAGKPISTTFEPRLALDGGPDGLDVIRRLVDQLGWGLAADGIALLEIGGDQGDAARALVAERLPDWSADVIPDLAGLPRVLRLARESA
ncbi:MAG TPA: peptide chain release factor N(5)-glutamine methyltransferase [Candidatus Limnocylindrales bacterium]|nr:peptide chain release factor N(5)-glutamine methyltransferase [Candidatus Limnocylindrales bacterium]